MITEKMGANSIVCAKWINTMFDLVKATVKPLMLNHKVLEAAYDLYLQAPQAQYPVIDLNILSKRTGVSRLECRNAIVEANQLGRFPNCSLNI
jgi:hypothetical protein